jgi:geranylgeranyl diphosphate synthase type II
MEVATTAQKKEMNELMKASADDKVKRMLSIFRACGVDEEAKKLKEKYSDKAFQHLEDIAVMSKRKEPLRELAKFLVQRDF